MRGNLLECLPFADGRFDFVHQRLLTSGVPLKSWLAVIEDLARVTQPGGRRYYDAQRARKKGHEEALRILANHLVGILHGCLRHHQLYGEDIAWPSAETAAA